VRTKNPTRRAVRQLDSNRPRDDDTPVVVVVSIETLLSALTSRIAMSLANDPSL
jgi:hypothetical protein